jgi:hypothetical protein
MKSEIKKILFIDDCFENGITALNADPRIEFFTKFSAVARPLQEYDVIITDMQMEHSLSGLEVVQEGLKAGRLPYIATGGTYEHGGRFDRVTLLNSNFIRTFDKTTKKEESFWRGALTFIEEDQAKNTVMNALNQVYSTIGIVPGCTIDMLMKMYTNNYKQVQGEK